MICILFSKVPEGTYYTRGAYSWVKAVDARRYISDGFGTEYDPIKKKTSPFTAALDEISKRAKKKKSDGK